MEGLVPFFLNLVAQRHLLAAGFKLAQSPTQKQAVLVQLDSACPWVPFLGASI